MAECDPREISFFHHDRAFRFHDPPTPLPHRWIKAKTPARSQLSFADTEPACGSAGCDALDTNPTLDADIDWRQQPLPVGLRLCLRAYRSLTSQRPVAMTSTATFALVRNMHRP